MAKIFIAGSKELVHERSIIREELSKVENLLDFDVRALTFEDFKTSLKGERGGRQTDYNTFIRDEADVVVFNTCAIRESAEQKIFGNIGELKN